MSFVNFGYTITDFLLGRHERMLGRALAGRRDKVIVCTKFGNIDKPDGSKAYNGSPEYVRSACDASLKQLGLSTIDLYYLHRIDPDVPIEETVGAMAGLVRAMRRTHAKTYPVSVCGQRTYTTAGLSTSRTP